MSTYGVKGVNNQLTVKPAPTKDFAVEQAVKETLKSTPALQKSNIQVSVSDSVVVLKGTVETQSQSRAAEFAAKTVPGSVRVVNMIKGHSHGRIMKLRKMSCSICSRHPL